LRAGFGVGAKADALVFLLGLRGAWASVRVISLATGYSSVAIRKAVGEMTLARLIRETDGRPAEYLAPAQPWGVLLELFQIDGQPGTQAEVPAWRFWSEIFAFLVSVAEWSRQVQLAPARSPHIVASEARDVVKRHTRAFDLNGISTPPMNAFTGLEAVHGLVETTRIVTGWMESSV